MHYCDCGCIDPEDVRKLASKKLRDLEEDDFSSYHGSALYTWGDLDHYKHFLPRVLEVHRELNGRGLVGLFEISNKLEYAKWAEWDKSEVSAIKQFVLADWIEFANKHISEIGLDDLEYYSKFHDMRELLKLWRFERHGTALKNFVRFFYYYGTQILNGGIKIKDEHYESEFVELLNRKGLILRLENEFFKHEKIDNDYARKRVDSFTNDRTRKNGR